jgi:hypothetical protein
MLFIQPASPRRERKPPVRQPLEARNRKAAHNDEPVMRHIKRRTTP